MAITPGMSEEDVKAVVQFRRNTIQLYLQILDARSQWQTLVALVARFCFFETSGMISMPIVASARETCERSTTLAENKLVLEIPMMASFTVSEFLGYCWTGMKREFLFSKIMESSSCMRRSPLSISCTTRPLPATLQRISTISSESSRRCLLLPGNTCPRRKVCIHARRRRSFASLDL